MGGRGRWRLRRFAFCLPYRNSPTERWGRELDRGKVIAISKVGGLHYRYGRAAYTDFNIPKCHAK